MKIQKPFIEIVRFEAEDVIATSGTPGPKHAFAGVTGVINCDNLNAEHSYIESHSIIASYPFGTVYAYTYSLVTNGSDKEYQGEAEHYGFGLGACPYPDIAAGNWYFKDSNGNWILCESGQ